jgi:enamine deaminase RidA (YjgF/YER057c/UK114 family)
MLRRECKTIKLDHDLICQDKSLVSGENDSLKNVSLVWKTKKEKGAPLFFPPQLIIEVKALACQLPKEFNKRLSRFTAAELAHLVVERTLVTSISGTTVWRWLDADAIKPWQYHSWIFPRDPDFQRKAGRVLDLYQGEWNGKFLTADEYVISADEKTSIQARHRLHETTPPRQGQAMRVEFEYVRKGALAYLAAWDVHRAKIFGRCDETTGIKPFDALVELVMSQEPYKSAKRVFWVMDNGSSHRGESSIKRLTEGWKNIVPVHLPVHASWLNQIEIYFSIIQRKVLTPNYFSSLREVEDSLIGFQSIYEQRAKPFKWVFTREDMNELLQALSPWAKTK